jgi:hypothetical protein
VDGARRDGKSPREFILWLIQESPATNVAINDCSIWKSTDFGDTDRLVTEAIAGKPRQASILITIDYNIQDDWIDNECRSCGRMYGIHSQCKLMDDIEKEWNKINLTLNP